MIFVHSSVSVFNNVNARSCKFIVPDAISRTPRLSNKLPDAGRKGRPEGLIHSSDFIIRSRSGSSARKTEVDGHHDDSKAKATTQSETEESSKEALRSISPPRPYRPQTVTLSKRSVPSQPHPQPSPRPKLKSHPHLNLNPNHDSEES